VTGAASIATRRALERIDNQRRLALLKQFEHEMRVQGEEVVTSVQRIVASEAVLRVAAEAGRPEPDFASFYNSAPAIAQTAGLDFVDVTRRDLTILSSAHWPARFGYRNDWVTCSPCESRGSFLVRIPMPDSTSSVALAAVRAANEVLVIGARRLDAAFLKSLGEAPGMRAVLWLSPQEVFDAQG